MLAALLAPFSQEEFLDRYWTRRFLHVPGPSAKFAHLFDWNVLSRSLEQHRFQEPRALPPRLGLVKSGQKLKTEAYLDGETVNAHNLTRYLSDGATLILNFCEEVHPPLRDLCVHLGKLFHVHVYANLYAGWRKDNGFDVHWDDHDTLILQVAGRKHWKVWRPTRSYPFRRDIVDTSPSTRPDGPPIWDGVLEQGGLLSMPRGWWHVAYPMDEPCLHVTVTITNLNGIDLLHWLAGEMKVSETARMELPLMSSEAEKRAWLDDLRQDLAAALTDDVLKRYLTHVDGQAKPRPSLNLPALTPPVTFVAPSTTLQLDLARPLQFETTNDTTKFFAAGHDWQIASELVPALARFNDGLPHSAAEVSPEGGIRLTALLTALVLEGVMRPATS